ncbi:MAG: hypothetical protein JWN81_785 [Solirubrobacterales bacterium]|nr:hypothetical protein [Solirubrobacterales bacterium]
MAGPGLSLRTTSERLGVLYPPFPFPSKRASRKAPPQRPRETAPRPLKRYDQWAREDSNLRPTDYESAALTN